MSKTETIIGAGLGEMDPIGGLNCQSVNSMVVIASGKGGVGKSTLSANLGIALGQMGQRVCLFDADTNLANINILFGINPRQTLHEYINGTRSLEEILLTVSERLKIVPAASGIAEFMELGTQQQERLLQGLKTIERQHEVILVDSAAGVGSGQLSFFLAAACPVLVITPEPTSLTDAFSFLKIAKRYGFGGALYIVVNLVPDLHTARSTFKRFKRATEQYLQLQVGYLGYVLQDQQVPASVRGQQPVMLAKPDALASRCVRVISERLIRLLQNQKRDAASFSGYLQEMNKPFGIELQPGVPSEVEAPADDWQQQVLVRLGALEKQEAAAFLRAAIGEWATEHGADERELLNRSQPVRVEQATVVAPAPPQQVDQPGVVAKEFQGVLAGSPYCAAVQFAELLAQLEKRQTGRSQNTELSR